MDKLKAAYLKGEFEAEGLSQTEIAHLLGVARGMKLGFAVKIGGCEALNDFKFCNEIGADSVIAPMVESPFAVEKFASMMRNVGRVKRPCINIETVTGVKNIEAICAAVATHNIGIVFGRTDYSASAGVNGQADSSLVIDAIREVAFHCEAAGVELTVGGAMNYEGYSKLVNDPDISKTLRYVETRKVVFSTEQDLAESDFQFALSLESKILSTRAANYNSAEKEISDRLAKIKSRV